MCGPGAMVHGRDFSYCRASEQKSLGRFSLELWKDLKTMDHSEGISNLTLQTDRHVSFITIGKKAGFLRRG